MQHGPSKFSCMHDVSFDIAWKTKPSYFFVMSAVQMRLAVFLILALAPCTSRLHLLFT